MPVSTWDSGLFGSTWDSGLQWDVNIGPSPGDTGPYIELVTSEHRELARFIPMMRATIQPVADIIALLERMPAIYDLDEALGAQLDAVGLWVGATRFVRTPITDVYFSFDIVGLGWDEGTWLGPHDPITGLTSLPDGAYRTLIRARIANNQWDGTIPGAYATWDALFAGTGFGILIQDLGGMHMLYAITGPQPDALTLALFTGGELNIKPAGVRIDAFLTPASPDVPYFGWDADGPFIAGWDTGYFGNSSPGT